MWGTIIGDIAGSTHEIQQLRKISPVIPKQLITDESYYTDDTILTVAIYEAIKNHVDYETILRKYGKLYLDYVPNTNEPHFKSAFGSLFIKWLNKKSDGTSIGNGAMMRISPIGKMFDTEKDVVEQAMLATKPSHNSLEAIDCSRTVALVIFYARMGMPKDEIRSKIGFTTLQYRPFETFNKTCYETLENCLFATFESSNFEEAIRRVLSFGGDTDTNAAIVGGMAEALYGVPEYLITQARKKLPGFFKYFVDNAYSKKLS